MKNNWNRLPSTVQLQLAFVIRPTALRYGYDGVYVHGRNSR